MPFDDHVSYEDLFTTMPEMFFVCEIVRDQGGQPQDVRYLEANPAYCALARREREEIVGHTHLELFPSDPPFKLKLPRLAQVVLSGQPDRFEQPAEVGGRYFDVLAYAPRPGQCAALMSDITERRTAERALRSSEAMYRTLVETAAEGLVIAAPDGECQYANQRLADMLGYPLEEMLGKSALDFMFDDERPQIVEARQDLKRGKVVHGEFKFRRKDGSALWSAYRATPLFNDQGEHTANLALYTDITGRVQAEAALRESETRYRSLFSNSHSVMLLIDAATGQIVDANTAACRYYGYSLAELKARNINNINTLPPEQVARELAEAQARRRNHFLFTHRLANSELRPVEVFSSPLELNGQRLLYSIIHDITQRKEAEALLELLKHSIDTAPDGAYWMDTEGRFVYANETAWKMLGYSQAELLQMRVFDVNPRVTPERWAEVWRTIREKGAYTSESVHRRKDGTLFPVEISSAYVKFGDEEYCNGFAHDISERKQAERVIGEQKDKLLAQNEELLAQNEELTQQGRAVAEMEASLREMNRELEARVQARSAELRAANAELQRANAALLRANRLKDEFLANVSHELRTPLSGILGLAEVTQRGIYGDLSDKQTQALQMIRSSGEHLLDLINDILDLSKVEAGKMELVSETVMVELVCQASLAFIQPMARNKNIAWSFRQDYQVVTLTADSRRLKQMLVNLLSNAVKFTPEGGQVGLEVEGDPERREVRFTVWDTGIGIAPERQADLFQPFVQLDGSLARKYEGTGLGLALVHSLAELHGGRVAVASAGVGRGARFTLALPWSPEPTPQSPTPNPAPGAAGQPLPSLARQLGRVPKILAADDNLTTLTVLSSFLEALECEVITAQNGAEALAQAQAAQPDVILLDIHMPDLDGLTVLRRLRASGSTVPVIALTALAMPEDRERCLAAGANEYMTKPMSLSELAGVITRLLKPREA